MQKKSGKGLLFSRNLLFSLLLSSIILLSGHAQAMTYNASDIIMTPGGSPTELNFNWYSSSQTSSLVQIALKADMSGSDFPESTANSFYATSSSAASGYYSNKATATLLTAGTEYVYRVGDGSGNWSDNYYVTTAPQSSFSFLAVGDPQIGSSDTNSDAASWTNTLNQALNRFSDIAFIMSTGDQVEDNNNESQFTGFFSPDTLRNIPLAPALGNHDNGAYNTGYHFNLPNLSASYGITSPGSANYYFTYGNALFVILNSNNGSGAEHEAFINEAVSAFPSAKWKIAMFHHDIYGSAYHALESSVRNLRAALFPVFDNHGFDVVINGHDHSYSRSHVLYGDVAQKDQIYDGNGSVVNPNGTVYFTLNSATGSKYYSLNIFQADYCAFRTQIYEPTFSYVTVNGDTLTFDTYRTDTMNTIDTFSIVKTGEIVAVTGVELNNDNLSLEVGNTATLTATVLPTDATNTNVTWSTNNSGVATVSEGEVMAVGAGEATITVTTVDGNYTDTCLVTVTGNGGINEVTAQISTSMDDVEELVSNGSMYTNSSDLELVNDDYAGGDQVVGLRFTGLAVPQGATVIQAYIQFTSDETDSGTTNLTIMAQATDDAEAFTTSDYEVSSRDNTTASATWSPAPWNTVGEAGMGQQTPDLSDIIQEVVDRSGWNTGNAIVIKVTGSGTRTAESYDGSRSKAPLLYIKYLDAN